MSGDWLFKAVPFFIVFVFCVIVAVWIVGGYAAYQVALSGPEGIGRAIGELLKGVDEGRK